jgi:hypothetical protein
MYSVKAIGFHMLQYLKKYYKANDVNCVYITEKELIIIKK